MAGEPAVAHAAASAPAAQAGRIAGWLIGAALLGAVGGGIGVTRWALPVEMAGPLTVSRVVEIAGSASAHQIGRQLEALRLVRSGELFAWAARLAGLDRSLQAGFYRLNPTMNLWEVLHVLSRGTVAVETVTIPEGATVRQIAGLLDRRGLADADRFIQLAGDDRWLFVDGAGRPLGKPVGSLEGYLFPDTYRIAVGQPEENIIRRMVARMLERLQPLYDAAPPPGLTFHQAVTLASIVEKEAMRDAERPLIASVFFNRLRRGMPLQADPTLKYILDPAPRRLLRQHLNIRSPYNTYRTPGLPPTPIAAPGEASFRAVLHPAATDFLYFVARGDGAHVFSRTFQEHVMARRRLAF